MLKNVGLWTCGMYIYIRDPYWNISWIDIEKFRTLIMLKAYQNSYCNISWINIEKWRTLIMLKAYQNPYWNISWMNIEQCRTLIMLNAFLAASLVSSTKGSSPFSVGQTFHLPFKKAMFLTPFKGYIKGDLWYYRTLFYTLKNYRFVNQAITVFTCYVAKLFLNT